MDDIARDAVAVEQHAAKIVLGVGVAELRRRAATTENLLPAILGAVAWISTAADDQTRTVKVRVDVENPRLKLKPFRTIAKTTGIEGAIESGREGA